VARFCKLANTLTLFSLKMVPDIFLIRDKDNTKQ